jgi:hypothetical protein
MRMALENFDRCNDIRQFMRLWEFVSLATDIMREDVSLMPVIEIRSVTPQS